MEILTSELSKLVSMVSPGVGNVRLYPATSYIYLDGVKGSFSATATDGANFLTATILNRDFEEFGPVLVHADNFSKLISKTTKASVKINIREDHLSFVGNGNYKIPIIDFTEFPNIDFTSQKTLLSNYPADNIKTMFSINKSAISSNNDYPILAGYLVTAGVTTTDRLRMCINSNPNFVNDDKLLLSQKFVDLLSTFTSPITLETSAGGNLRATSSELTLVGPQLAGIDKYPNLDGLLSSLSHSYNFSVNRNELISILDRLLLFVDATTAFGVRLYSDGEILCAVNTSNTGKETLSMQKCGEDFSFDVNAKLFIDLLEVLKEETVNIQYQSKLPIKILEKNVTILLATLKGSK